MNRRGFLTSLGAALAAPAVITTPGLLMPVRSAPARIVHPFDQWSETCPRIRVERGPDGSRIIVFREPGIYAAPPFPLAFKRSTHA